MANSQLRMARGEKRTAWRCLLRATHLSLPSFICREDNNDAAYCSLKLRRARANRALRRAGRRRADLHKDLSLDIAKTIAESAVAACAAKGFAVSAVVVNRDGDTIVARGLPAYD